MKVGVIVDGQAEYRSLDKMKGKIETSNDILTPLYVDIQPYSKSTLIAKRVKPHIRAFARKGVGRVIILVDLEDWPECASERADQIECAVRPVAEEAGIMYCSVVIKNAIYENWLVSDIDNLLKMGGRFSVSASAQRQIAPNKADQCNALHILKAAAVRKEYSKVKDAIRIMNGLDPYSAAQNSRSFRRFLRVVGCRVYETQSKRPV
jgi:hypothetical protein